MSRYELCPPPGEAHDRGFSIYDNAERRRIPAPGFPGYWRDESEALMLVDELNGRARDAAEGPLRDVPALDGFYARLFQ